MKKKKDESNLESVNGVTIEKVKEVDGEQYDLLQEQFNESMLREWLQPWGDEEDNMSEDDGYEVDDIDNIEDDDFSTDKVSREEAEEEFHDSMLKEWLLPASEDRNDEDEESEDDGFNEEEDGSKDKLEKEVRKDLNVKDKYIEDLKEKLKEMTLKAENEYRKRLKAEAEAERAQKIIDALLEGQDLSRPRPE